MRLIIRDNDYSASEHIANYIISKFLAFISLIVIKKLNTPFY
jgi:hypothetical protein